MKKFKSLLIGCMVSAMGVMFLMSCQKESPVGNSVPQARFAASSRTLDTLAFMQKMHNDAMQYLYDALQADLNRGKEITQTVVKNHLLSFAESYNYAQLKGIGGKFESLENSLPNKKVKEAIGEMAAVAFESTLLTSQGGAAKGQIVVLPKSITLDPISKKVKAQIESAILQSSNHTELAVKAKELLATARAGKGSSNIEDLATAMLLENSANILAASNEHWETAVPAWEEVFYMSYPANKGKKVNWKKVGNVLAADAVGALIGFFTGGLWGSIGTAIAFSAAAAVTEIVVAID